MSEWSCLRLLVSVMWIMNLLLLWLLLGILIFWCCRRGGEWVCCVTTVGKEVPASIIWSGGKGVHEVRFGVMWQGLIGSFFRNA